jgi:hypothetical protein
VEDVATYATDVASRPGKFQQPLGYIRRPARGPVTEDEDYVEYDLEYEDEQWLRANSRIGERADPLSRLSTSTFERIIDVLEKMNGERAQGTASVMTAADAEQVVANNIQARPTLWTIPDGLAVGGPGFSRAIADIYAYWVAKRAKLKKPLLRRFWQATSVSDTNPHHTFRPHDRTTYKLRRTRRNDSEVYRKLLNLRSDMRGGLELLKIIKEREAMKHEALRVQDDYFEQVLWEAVDTTGTKRQPATLIAFRERKKKESTMLRLKLKLNRPANDAATLQADQQDDEDGYNKQSRMAQPLRKDKALVLQGQKQRLKAPGPPAASAPAEEQEKRPQQVPRKQRPEQASVPQTPAVVQEPAPPAYPPHAAYPGFKLGPWSVPSSVGVQGVHPGSENAVFEPEDILSLQLMQSIRLGVMPSVLEGHVKKQHLPSGNTVYPMDESYKQPHDGDAFYGDISVQRRLLNLRSSGGRTTGAVCWEEGSGSGLVPGVGSGISPDGANWAHVGSRIEASISSLDEPMAPQPAASRKRKRDHQHNGARDFVLRARLGRNGRVVFDRIPKVCLTADASSLESVAHPQLLQRQNVRDRALKHISRAMLSGSESVSDLDLALPGCLNSSHLRSLLHRRVTSSYSFSKNDEFLMEETAVHSSFADDRHRGDFIASVANDSDSANVRSALLSFISDPTHPSMMGKSIAKKAALPAASPANDTRALEVYKEQDSDAEDMYDDESRTMDGHPSSSLLACTLETLLRATPLS